MGRRKMHDGSTNYPPGTNGNPSKPWDGNPGSQNPVLVAADLHNRANGFETSLAMDAFEAGVAKKFTIHFDGDLGCKSWSSGSRPVHIIAPLDHPAMCPTCLEKRTKEQKQARSYGRIPDVGRPILVAR